MVNIFVGWCYIFIPYILGRSLEHGPVTSVFHFSFREKLSQKKVGCRIFRGQKFPPGQKFQSNPKPNRDFGKGFFNPTLNQNFLNLIFQRVNEDGSFNGLFEGSFLQIWWFSDNTSIVSLIFLEFKLTARFSILYLIYI